MLFSGDIRRKEWEQEIRRRGSTRALVGMLAVVLLHVSCHLINTRTLQLEFCDLSRGELYRSLINDGVLLIEFYT